MINTLFWRDWKRTTADGRLNQQRLFIVLLVFAQMLCCCPWYKEVAVITPGSGPLPFAGLRWTLLAQQYVVIFLFTAILSTVVMATDKLNGTLFALMLTPIKSRDVILSKSFVVMVRIFDLAIIPLPIAIFIGGITFDPTEVTGRMLKPLIWLPMATAIGLLSSVMLRGLRMALLFALAVPVLIVGTLESTPMPTPCESLRVCIYGMVSMGITMLTLILTSFGLRSKVIAHTLPASTVRKPHRRHRSEIGDDPIRWLESGRAMIPILRWLPRWLLPMLFGIFITAVVAPDGLLFGSQWMPLRPSIVLIAIPLMGMMCLLVAVRSVVSFTTERSRQTWDSLRVTPISAQAIVHGKINGILDQVRPYMIAYALAMTGLAVIYDQSALTTIVIICATMWVMVDWSAVIGMSQAVQASNLGFALLGMVGEGFLIGLLIAGIWSFTTMIISLVLLGTIFIQDDMIFLVIEFILTPIFLLIARAFANDSRNSTVNHLQQQSQPVIDPQSTALNPISNEGPP